MLARVFSFGVPLPSRRRQVIGVAIAASVLFGAGVLSWVADRPVPGKNVTHLCLVDGSPTQDEEAADEALCDRQARDEYNRAIVPSATAMDAADVARIWRAIEQATCQPYLCMNTAGRAATEADAELIRRALRDESQPHATVRLARPEDPAPIGTIMFAVALRDGFCLIAYATMGAGVMNSHVGGVLPGGLCLAQ